MLDPDISIDKPMFNQLANMELSIDKPNFVSVHKIGFVN